MGYSYYCMAQISPHVSLYDRRQILYIFMVAHTYGTYHITYTWFFRDLYCSDYIFCGTRVKTHIILSRQCPLVGFEHMNEWALIRPNVCIYRQAHYVIAWWRHQLETFSGLLDLCEGNPSATIPKQRPVTRSFDVFFDLRLNAGDLRRPRVRYDVTVLGILKTKTRTAPKAGSQTGWMWWQNLATGSPALYRWARGAHALLDMTNYVSDVPQEIMMTSSNENIFRVTGHLCGLFTGPRWIPRTKVSDAELWCFLSASE